MSRKGFMSVWKGVHIFLERGSCMSKMGFMSVWKWLHACVERSNACLERG